MRFIDNLKLNQTPVTAWNAKIEKAAPQAKAKTPRPPKDRVYLQGKKAGSPQAPKKWTVLAYLAGDCNLEEYMVQDLLDMEKIGSSQDMNLLVQIDRGDENATTQFSGGKPGASRYFVEKFKLQPGDLDGYTGENPPSLPRLRAEHDKITSPELKTFGQVDSSDPKVLKDFLTWGMKEYPAQNYLIIPFGHGGGSGGLITDEGAGPDCAMTLKDFGQAVKDAETAAGVDKSRVVMAMKSCQMGQIEVAYEMKDSVDFLLASQSTIYADTWPMEEIFSGKDLADKQPAEMGRYLFDLNTKREDDKEIATLSLLDLSKAPNLKNAVADFGLALRNSSADHARLKDILEIKSRPMFTENSEICHYNSDLYDAARRIARDLKIDDPGLKKTAKNLIAALDQVVIDAERNYNDFGYDKNAQGLGILNTSDPERFRGVDYQGLAFSRDTGWDQAMTAYAPEIGMKEMDQRLADAQLKSVPLKVMADIAKKSLKNFDGLDEDFDKAKEKIAEIKADPKRTPFKKFQKACGAVYNITPLDRMYWINYREEKDKTKNIIIDEAVSKVVKTAAEHPEEVKEITRAGLVVIAALNNGKVCTRTLGRAAKHLLNAQKDLEKDLSKEDRQLLDRFLQAKSRDEKVLLLDQMEKTQSPALPVSRMMMTGVDLLLGLGYATRNEKVVNVKNYSGLDYTAFLKNLNRVGEDID